MRAESTDSLSFFLSLSLWSPLEPKFPDYLLIIVIVVYYFQIWNKKVNNLISCRVMNSHMGPVYTETRDTTCPSSTSLCLA